MTQMFEKCFGEETEVTGLKKVPHVKHFFQESCQQPKNVLMELCFGTCSSSVAVESGASSLSIKEGLLRYLLVYSSCIRHLSKPQLTKTFTHPS